MHRSVAHAILSASAVKVRRPASVSSVQITSRTVAVSSRVPSTTLSTKLSKRVWLAISSATSVAVRPRLSAFRVVM